MTSTPNASDRDGYCPPDQPPHPSPPQGSGGGGAATCSASDLAVDALISEMTSMSLSSLEAAIQAKERELMQLKLQRQQRKPPHPCPSSDGNFICFGCVVFLPNPCTFQPAQSKWIDGRQSLNVPHIMLVVDYCTGELKTAGGRSNAGESPLDCMNREFLEETGYDSPICHFRDADLRYREQMGKVCAHSYVKYASFEVGAPPVFNIPAALHQSSLAHDANNCNPHPLPFCFA